MLHRGQIVEFDVLQDDEREHLIDALADRLHDAPGGPAPTEAHPVARMVVDLLNEELIQADGYRKIRRELQNHMGDPDAWDGDQPEDYILIKFIRWMAAATHGRCHACRREIAAGEQYEPPVNTGRLCMNCV